MTASTSPALEIRPCTKDADAQFFGVYYANVYYIGADGLSDHIKTFPARAEAEAHAATLEAYAARKQENPAAELRISEIDFSIVALSFFENGELERIADYPTESQARIAARYIADKAHRLRVEAYEEKQDAKRERYAELSAKHAAASHAAYDASRKTLDLIPPGQPILVGHHSERRHRRDLASADRNMSASIQHRDTAEHYGRKAENYGTHGISSDDPAAIDKLRGKLAGLEKRRDMAKAVNAHWRKHKTLEGCPGIDDADARALERRVESRHWKGNPPPFETYHFSNLSAEIRRVKDRIDALEKAAARGNVETEKDGYTYREDTAENRAMFIFPGKPGDDARAVLKGNGFKWSPTRGAWVRLLNNNARYAAERIMAILDRAVAE